MHADPPLGVCAAMESPVHALSSGAPLEWSVCPGAAETACMSEMPHGTIVTATSFTSLSLLHCELAGEEKVQYEVHLLTSGLLQCGWCVTPSGLPFTSQEGVGDFPMSVAADGLRGLVWNLTPADVPELRWGAGDILSCYADLGTGAFDFALNGQHCHTASLPTKALLLRHGARWYNDRHSTDEMLQYTPAMSLEGGEACVVNLGEAPMRYPRCGYRSICENAWSGNANSAAEGDGRSGAVALSASRSSTPVPVAALPAAGAASRHGGGVEDHHSGSGNSSFGAPYTSFSWSHCLTLGGIEMGPFLRAMALQVPLGIPTEGAYLFLRVLDPWAEEPGRVVERCARLVSWLQADVQGRWKAFTMWLYLWVTRLYVQLRDVSVELESVANLDGMIVLPSTEGNVETPAATLALLHDMWRALELFMPHESFAMMPGMMLALLQHRSSDSAAGQLMALRIVRDLVATPSFRRTWVADTVSCTSTLLNLFTIHSLAGGARGALVDALATQTPNNVILRSEVTLRATEHQARLWALASAVLDEVVRDGACRGALAICVQRYMGDKRLKSMMALAHRGADAASNAVAAATFLDAYPYTFASAFSPTVLGMLTLALTAALGACMPALADGHDDRPAPPPAHPNGDRNGVPPDAAVQTPSAAVLQRELSWRAVALSWLPPARFYNRPLAAAAVAPQGNVSNDGNRPTAAAPSSKDCIADRLGGALHTVATSIEVEMTHLDERRENGADTTATAAPAAMLIPQPVVTNNNNNSIHALPAAPLSGFNAPQPPQTTQTVAAEGPSLSMQEQQWREASAWHLERRRCFTALPPDAAGLGLNDGVAAATRGSVPGLPAAVTTTSTTYATSASVPPPPAPVPLIDVDARLAEALAERADELFLVTVVAFDLYVRGLLARCASLPTAIHHAVFDYQRAVTEKSALLETWNSTASVSGGDDAAHLRHVFELLLTTVPLRMDTSSAALANFCGVAGRVYGYYWARMAVFERCYCVPAQPVFYAAAEVQEAPHAPPRAFLMLPAQLSNVFVDLWLLLGLVRGHNADIAAQAPTLLRFFFDANMRRATSNLFAREYLYQAVTSVLGAGREDRLRMARQIAQLHRSSPAESPGTLSFMARHVADFLDMAQRSPHERAPVNFISALLQEERTLVPPPRMLDEKFGWLLHTQAPEPPRNAAIVVAAAATAATTAAVPTADDIYLHLLVECTTQYSPAALLFPLIYQANALLSRFSERLLPTLPRWAEESGETITGFSTLYHVLRKTLCAMHVMCEAVLAREVSQSAAGEEAVMTTSLLFPPAAATTPPSSSSSSGGCVSDDAPEAEDAAALRRELMDVVLQCLLRVMGPYTNSITRNAATAAGEQHDGTSIAVLRVSESDGGAAAVGEDSSQGDGNVLQPAVVCDVSGAYHWREVACTRVGLLSPLLAMLLRFLESGRRRRAGAMTATEVSVVTLNPFLALVGAELPTLVRAALTALDHTAWWTSDQRGATGDAATPASASPRLERLQHLLCEVEAACALLFPSAATTARSSRGTTHTTNTMTTAVTSALPAPLPQHQQAELSRASAHSRSLSGASAHTAECAAEEAGVSATATAAAAPTAAANAITLPANAHLSPASQSFSASTELPSSLGAAGDERGVAGDGEEGEGGGADEAAAHVCVICLSRRNDVRMIPCHHECCYGCLRRYQRVEHARQVAMEGSGHTGSLTPMSSPPLTWHGSRGTSEASGANSFRSAPALSDYPGRWPAVTNVSVAAAAGEEETGLRVLTCDTFTLSSVEHSIAAAETAAVRCFFCKEAVTAVEHLVSHGP